MYLIYPFLISFALIFFSELGDKTQILVLSFSTNPKQEVFIMAAKVDETKCVGCEACTGACPVEAISMVDGKAHVDDGKCIDCGACVGECPAEAISQ